MENISGIARNSYLPEAQLPLIEREDLAPRQTAQKNADLFNRNQDSFSLSQNFADKSNLYPAYGRQDKDSTKPSDGENTAQETQSKDAAAEAQGEEKPESSGGLPNNLTEEEQKEVAELKARDQEVRTHEQAHISAGGNLVGRASFETTRGPDGKSYATGGEVPIDTSEASTPEATIAKAKQIRSAALAPAQPSSQDRAIAAKASQMESEARQKQLKAQAEGTDSTGSTSGPTADPNEQKSEPDTSATEVGATGAEATVAGTTRAGTNTAPAAEPGKPAERYAESSDEQTPSVKTAALKRASKAYQKVSGVLPPVPYGSTVSIAV